MSFEVHLRLKDHELLFKAFFVQAKKVVCLEMAFKGIVVDIILVLAGCRASIANVASFVAVTAVSV
jgi:hypothetical protein